MPVACFSEEGPLSRSSLNMEKGGICVGESHPLRQKTALEIVPERFYISKKELEKSDSVSNIDV